MSIDAAMKALAALLLNQAEGREGKVSKSVLFHQLESEGHKRSDLEGAMYQMKELGLIGVGEDSSVIHPEPYLDWMGSLGKPGELPQRIVPKPQTTSWPVIWPLRSLREWYVKSLRGAGQQPPDVAHAPPGDLFAHFSTMQRRLLLLLDGKGMVPIVEVVRKLYGEDSTENREALKALVTRANRKVTERSLGLEIRKHGQYFSLNPVEPTSQ
jgi:hypothetical protein